MSGATAPSDDCGPRDAAPCDRAHRWWLALLVLACLAPRLIVGLRREVLCTDGVFYIEKAEALRTGDFAAGLYELGLNVYPLLLAAVRQMGVEYELGGKLFSLLCATAAVLPLTAVAGQWGGRHVGYAAGLLYALHPEAIDWSGEIVRDPLFWLLAWSTLWAGWRAATVGRAAWFAASGLLLTLSILTRFEGWLLALPLAWWWLAEAARRGAIKRLPLRIAAAAIVCPLALVSLNLGPLRGHARWEWGRFELAAVTVRWAQAAVLPAAPPSASSADAAAASPSAPQLGRTERFTLRAMRWGYQHTLVRGWQPAWLYLTLCGALLTLMDWWRSRRGKTSHSGRLTPPNTAVSNAAAVAASPRPAWLPVYAVVALLLASVWVYLENYGEINKRYFICPMLFCLPPAAVGLWKNITWLAAAMDTVARRFQNGSSHFAWQRVCGAMWLTALAWLGSADALTQRYDGREMKAGLGRWIAAEYGAGRRLLCSEDVERLVGYYAAASHRKLPDNVVDAEAAQWLRRWQPDVAVLWQPAGAPRREEDRYAALLDYAHSHGWQVRTTGGADALPPGIPAGMTLVVRPDVALAAASRGKRSELATKPAPPRR